VNIPDRIICSVGVHAWMWINKSMVNTKKRSEMKILKLDEWISYNAKNIN
jgi:hypothetical protein